MSRLGRSSTAFAASSACLERVAVVGDLAEVLDVPAVRREALADVVGRGELRRAVDRDAVVVEHDVEAAESEVAGERRRLVADALHEAAVAGDRPDVVVDERRAEAVAQEALGDGHADAFAKPWPSGPGRDLDAHRVPGLGVARRQRVERTERLEVVEIEAVAAQVEHRVLQDRRVAVGQDEAVAVGPRRVGRVVLHDPAVEHVGERGERHGGALVPALGVERSIHGEATDDVDGLLLQVGGEGRRRRCHARDPSQWAASIGVRARRTGRHTGGSSVNGTTIHGPRSMRQWAKTWP